jgi:ferredoxin
MPQVTAQGKTFDCETGANLRQVLLANGIDLYNGAATTVNCHGLGTCGTCAVQVEGEVSEAGWREKARRSLPPHKSDRDLRLSCQTKVIGDLRVTKYDGIWGQGNEKVWTPEG